jgi:hypothetical protein
LSTTNTDNDLILTTILQQKDLAAVTMGGWESHYGSFQTCTEELRRHASASATHEQAWLPQVLRSLSVSSATALSRCDGAEQAFHWQNNYKVIRNEYQQASQVRKLSTKEYARGCIVEQQVIDALLSYRRWPS